MSKFLKQQLSMFTAVAVMIILTSLLYGQQDIGLPRQEQESTGIKESQDRAKEVKEVRGVVSEVDLDRGRMVIDLSGEDSARLEGRTKATVLIDRDTKVENENNTKGSIFSIEKGASVKVKLADRMGAASTEVDATKVELEIACKPTQGCPESGTCGNACGSRVCACPERKTR